MKLVFTHENSLIVGNIYNILDQHNILAQIKNQYASGGAGDIAPQETWPELWVNDNDYQQASQIISGIDQQTENKHWICPKCKERNPVSFELCWHCQYEQT